MTNQKGSISIHTENIFPIIKKWLYSDKDIFIRELISNGCDAVNKYKKLISLGEAQGNADEQYKIKVSIDKENSALIFEDNGIGMTAEEVEKYINQVAFSGAEDFFNTYKDKMNEENDIIGHFGLGFYSSFMVSKKVQIDTLSYKENATPVRWVSEDGLEFELTQSDNRETRGTTITLFLADDSKEFLEEYTVRNIIDKYCSFLPVDIYLETIKTEETKEDEVVDITPINDTNPLWLKAPKDCTDEEYKEFYRKVFKTFDEPLFWIHLNVDYPFNLKGILYFPKLKNEFELIEGKVKLYNNQVFVADNIKEVIPEFLLLLKGVIDCPDLPLNVSRSFLQNDRDVSKISKHIVKKVADKLKSLYKNERENYEKFWDDIQVFIKFGCLKDDKFCEKMTDYILFKNLDGKYLTLPECLEVKKTDPDEQPKEENRETADAENKEEDTAATATDAETGEKVEAEVVTDDAETDIPTEDAETKEKIIYYVTDLVQQSQYVNMFKNAGMDAVVLPDRIDQPFVQQLESKNEGIKFSRIDADLTDTFKTETSKEAEEELTKKSEEITELFKKAVNNDKIVVKVEKLKNKDISSMITVSEEARRMQDMMKMYAMPGMGADLGMGKEGETLVLNAENDLVKYVLDNQQGENVELICEQLYDLALMQQSPLQPEAMTKFVNRSNKIMMLLAK